MDDKIIDGMKKESKLALFTMIFGYFLGILTLLSHFLNLGTKYSNHDIVLICSIYFVFGTFGLYQFVYAIKYKVEINNEKIFIKTLFMKINLNICDIEKYTCKRYMKSVFYQFTLFANGKKILVSTRYKSEFERILKNNNLKAH